MAEIVAAAPCRDLFPLVLRGGRSTSPPNAITVRWGKKKYEKNAMRNTTHSMILPAAAAAGRGMIGSKENKQPPADVVTFSSNISTELPLYERPRVSFDEYLLDRPRIFNAIFPDRCRSMRLNDEEWRIQMLPLQFLLMTVNPVVDMRLRSKSQGKEYPSSVSRNATSVLELQATRWELQGLDSTYMPSYFELSVQGVLYPDQNGGRRRLKGELEMSFSFVLPPVLALVPENVLRGVAESLLRRLVEKMKRDVDARLTEDFWRFQQEKLIEHEQAKRFRDSCNGSEDRRGSFLL